MLTANNISTTTSVVEKKTNEAQEFVNKYILPDGGLRFFAARGSQQGGYTQNQWRAMAAEIKSKIISGSIDDIRQSVIAKLAENGIDVSTYIRTT